MDTTQAGPRPQPASRWVDIDGETHYTDYGGPADGPVVVCVHGLGGSQQNWAAIGPELARTARVYAVDLAGHGRTRAHGRDTSVHANQRLLDRFLREVVGTPAILVGNSMGGMISILEASASPASVAGLVLVDPALPRARNERPDPLVAVTFAAYALPLVGESFLARRRRQMTPEKSVAQTLALCCVDPRRVPRPVVDSLVELARERADYVGVEGWFLAAARSLLKVNLRPARYRAMMRGIDVPVLLLHGARDRLVSLASAQEAAATHPDWRFEVARDIGHVPQLEAPDWTVGMIRDWMATDGLAAVESARDAVAD